MNDVNNPQKFKYDPSRIDMSGNLGIDTDGGPKRNDLNWKPNTSATKDSNGNYIPRGDHDPSLNPDKDPYVVAPGNSGIKVGDLATITEPDGTQRTYQVGDIGPEGKAGEVASATAKDMGDNVSDTPDGPVVNGQGTPVTVTFYRGTHKY